LKHAAADLLAGKQIGKDETVAYAKLTLTEVAGKLADPESPPPR